MVATTPSTEPQPSTAAVDLALSDIADGLRHWRLWILLGWQDIRQRYRRSVLGPFWLTLSMGILVGTLGVLYGVLFGLAIDDYLPFLALGFLAWWLISGVVTDGCMAFIDSEHLIKQVKLPFSMFVYRVVWRNLTIFAHNFVVYLVVAVAFGIWPGAAGLLLLPGLVLIAANAIWIGLLLGMVCARFRDVPQIVTSLLQVAFFLTPIIWMPQLLGDRIAFVHANPFFHFVELVRAPLLGQVPVPLTWAVTVSVTAVGWLVTLLVFRRFRNRIPYWL
jgi:ABC-type polysaccharide/polyol phosphate export permease